MNSKERVRMSIELKQPDKVPSAMECVDVTWEKLCGHFSVSDRYHVMDILDIDIRTLDIPPYIGKEKPNTINENGQIVYTHPFGYKYVKHWNGVELNDHTVYYPLDGIDDMEKFTKYDRWPDPDDYDYSEIKRFCERFEDRAICVGWPGPFQVFTFYMPMEQCFLLMGTEPCLAKKMFDRYMQFNLELYERMFCAARGQIDILMACDDYGTQIGMLFGVNMWRQFFEENTRKLVQLAHKHGVYYMQHSCGAVRPIIPELIKCCVDVLDPLQKVEGMSPQSLKRDFGDKLAFKGGIDTQELLPVGTPQQVKAETESVIQVLYPGGGYILSPSQCFEGDIPIENILALYDAREKFE